METLPIWLQKLGRFARLVSNLAFISGSNYLSMTDYIFRNRTSCHQNDVTSNDRIFASRQEVFSLIYVKFILAFCTITKYLGND